MKVAVDNRDDCCGFFCYSKVRYFFGMFNFLCTVSNLQFIPYYIQF